MHHGLSDFDRGLLVGLLVGEGSFGGDGKQPQVTLRMHTRHEAVFRWLVDRFPETKLYGPYSHGGRSYYQWMARGRPLVDAVLPVLEGSLTPDVDAHAAERLAEMQKRYAAFIARERGRSRSAGGAGAAGAGAAGAGGGGAGGAGAGGGGAGAASGDG